ncbi:paraplegin-like [Mya arenaria]|uniref:paraplegin-like n=1 Tax=Mya arenaria TaxID=6604 RepID=UPI0022E55476|nr:paraplegin-like [Mya arenaria]
MAAFMVAKRCILLSRQVLCPTRLSFSIPRFKRSYCCISLKYVCKDHHRAHLFASYLMRNPGLRRKSTKALLKVGYLKRTAEIFFLIFIIVTLIRCYIYAWYENVMFGHAISFEDYVDRYLKTDLVEKDAYIYKTMMQIQENDKGVWKRLRDSGFFSQKRPVDEYEHVLISLNFEKIKEKFNGEFPKELVKPPNAGDTYFVVVKMAEGKHFSEEIQNWIKNQDDVNITPMSYSSLEMSQLVMPFLKFTLMTCFGLMFIQTLISYAILLHPQKFSAMMRNFSKTRSAMKKNLDYLYCQGTVPEVRLKDVVGHTQAKNLLDKNARQLKRASLSKPDKIMRQSILLVGPKGCGKSVLTQAFAGEIGAPLVNKSRLATSVVDSCKIHKGFIDVDSLKNVTVVCESQADLITYLDLDDTHSNVKEGNQKILWDLQQKTSLIHIYGMEDSTTFKKFKADKKILKKKESNKKPGLMSLEIDSEEDIDPNQCIKGYEENSDMFHDVETLTIDLSYPTFDDRKALFATYMRGLTSYSYIDDVVADLSAITEGKSAPEIVEVCKKIAEWKHPQISHPDDKNVYQSTCLRIERASNMAKWVPVPLQSEVIALHRAGHTLLAARLEHFNILPKLVQEPSDPQQFQGFMEVIPPKSLNHSGDQLFNLLSLNMAGVLAELVSRKCLTTVGKNFFEKVQADFKTKIRDQVIMTMKQPELKMALSHTGRSSGTLDEALIADALVERDVNNTIGMIFTQTEEVLQKDRDILQQLTSHFLQHSLKRTEIDYKRVAHILQTSKQFEVWSWDRKTKSTPD